MASANNKKMIEAVYVAVEKAHESRGFAKALRVIEKTLLTGLGFETYAEYLEAKQGGVFGVSKHSEMEGK